MICTVARILCALSITLALAFASGTRLEAAPNCPFASTMKTGPAHHDTHTMFHDTGAKSGMSHHETPAAPEPCKHGCNAIAFLVPPVTESPAREMYRALIQPDRPAPVSQPTPPFERPPKRVT